MASQVGAWNALRATAPPREGRRELADGRRRGPRTAARGVFALLVATWTLAASNPTSAHEFWVEPDRFRPALGETTPVHLYVGEAGERSELERRRTHLRRFEALDASGAIPVLGRFGRAPAGWFQPRAEGQVLVAYQGSPTYIEIPAEKFESYLTEESLTRVIAERVRAGQSLEPGRESYARYAKSLLVVGNGGSPVFDRQVGFPLEIVARTDPEKWRGGDTFSVEVFYDGRPLADQQVKLIHLRDGELRLLARTDANGRVDLRPPQAGPWLLATVFMRAAPDAIEGDWESFWGSLSFELPHGEAEGAR